jgi:hypothetical protein
VALFSESQRKILKRTAMVKLAAVARNKGLNIGVFFTETKKRPAGGRFSEFVLGAKNLKPLILCWR